MGEPAGGPNAAMLTPTEKESEKAQQGMTDVSQFSRKPALRSRPTASEALRSSPIVNEHPLKKDRLSSPPGDLLPPLPGSGGPPLALDGGVAGGGVLGGAAVVLDGAGALGGSAAAASGFPGVGAGLGVSNGPSQAEPTMMDLMLEIVKCV